MAINRIAEVMNQKGYDDLKPSDRILEKLGIPDLKKWNKWVNKKSDPELRQLNIIAEFLNCEINDLVPTKQEH